jgi:hypothetical protein
MHDMHYVPVLIWQLIGKLPLLPLYGCMILAIPTLTSTNMVYLYLLL